MELILAIGIGIMTGSGVWAHPAPAHLSGHRRPVRCSPTPSISSYSASAASRPMRRRCWSTASTVSTLADPVPQALVLTAIVIGFATTALFLVVLLAARGLTGTDHVDGRESK